MVARWRRLLLPTVPIYAAAIGAKWWLIRRGVLRQRKLGHPVISVGSLSAGGAGKTPMVTLLAELLSRRGFEVRILTRGYGRRSRIVQRVGPNGDANEFGDEPLMMARRLPQSAIWVGADRHRAGRLAEGNDLPDAKVVYLLDDGFQHRKLARDVDIVLVTRQDMKDSLLPTGNLREPLQALARSSVLVVRADEAELVDRIRGRVPGVPVWIVQRQLRFADALPLPVRPLVFCALARPEGFLEMLVAEGVLVAGTAIFRDHYAYSDRDVERLVKDARACNADGFVTTEKDAVKLSQRMIDRLRMVGPVAVAQLQVRLLDQERCVGELAGLLP